MDEDLSIPFALDTATNYMPEIQTRGLPVVACLKSGGSAFDFLLEGTRTIAWQDHRDAAAAPFEGSATRRAIL